MLCSAPFRLVAAAFAICIALPGPLAGEDGGGVGQPKLMPSHIVVGFVGGFVRHDNPHHGPVQLAQRLQRAAPKNALVRVFENRHRRSAYKTVVRSLDRNSDGTLSAEEKSQAQIILFGHSWGASAAVALARDLKRAGIPVLLTVQVDSVAKPWQNDDVIPENVEAAVNFYQPHGLIHGQSVIKAADPAKTQILGNYRFDYKKAPVKCESVPWIDRVVMPSHLESECDPHIWGQVEQLVRERMQSGTNDVAQSAGQ